MGVLPEREIGIAGVRSGPGTEGSRGGGVVAELGLRLREGRRVERNIKNSRDSKKQEAEEGKGYGNGHVIAEAREGLAEIGKGCMSNPCTIQVAHPSCSRACTYHCICKGLVIEKI
ncbi:uncharacterized protein A4U43_C05F26350 [Asparagus officinalis]|uniref:Uncharacterized protein n=1 Tax=Asparagus officinalis TaxID=4686 RepID=A0A5P1EUT5_ASPOF|nr:uncharacterized protein A4U43_C05F26350 [Asparagus officinalis]